MNFDHLHVYDVDSAFIVNLGGLENTAAAYIPMWDVFLLNTEYIVDDISRLHSLAHESVHKIYYDSNPNFKLGLELTLSKRKNKRIGSNVIFYEGETEKLTLDFLNSKYPEVVSDNKFDMTRSYMHVPYLCNILSKTTNLDSYYWKNDIKSFSKEFDEIIYSKTGKLTGGTPTELLLYACDQSYYGDYTISMASAWELVGIAIAGTGHENDYINIFKSFDKEVCNNQLHNSDFEVYLNTLISE